MRQNTRVAQTIARYAARQDTIATRTRVRTASVPSARPLDSDIWRVSVLSAIRAKRITRRTSVRISDAHIARNTVMMRRRCPEKPTPICYACGSSTHQTPRSVDCSEHKCATCQGELEPKGHNHKNCPLAQCDACNLSRHIADVCSVRQCYDVEVVYLNLLLLTKGRHTIESYFDANGQACIQPNALRIHGKFTESNDWDEVKQRFAITDRQVLELKSVAHDIW